jgi:hypothetical protein
VDTKEIAEKYMWSQTEAWQNGNINAFGEIEDQNVVFHYLPQFTDVAGGLVGHKQHVVDKKKVFSNLKVSFIKYIAGEGNLFSFIGSGSVM